MKAYELILLKFTTPVHFGDAGEGGDLGNILSFCRSDTFFSALCREAADLSPSLLSWLSGAAEKGSLRISDLLPWRETDTYELYLPRPVLPVNPEIKKNLLPFTEEKENSKARKAIKKRSFIRAGGMDHFLKGLKAGNLSLSEEPSFGEEELRTRFNGRLKLPYDVGTWHFSDHAGLYVILSAEEKDLKKMENLIRLLGLSGIGGKRSSGFGHYEFEDDPLQLSGDEIYGEDDAALYRLLTDEKAPHQMTISSFIPKENEISSASRGTGRLIRRGGFAWSRDMEQPVKTNSIYMMAAGSCFPQRMEGRLADVNNGSAPHPVYKYGKGLFVGLKL